MLSRHQADPRSETAARRKLFPISHLGHQRGSDDRANARDFLQPSAFLTRAVPGMDAFLDGYDLGPDNRILASKDVEAQPRDRWNAIIVLVSNNPEQLCRAIAALSADNAELGHVPTDGIRQHRSLTNQKLPAAVQHQARLLLCRLRRHKSHRRSRDRLADCGCVVGIIFAALNVGLHVARRHQPHRVAERLKPAAPIMCGRTRLNADEAGRQGREELQQLCSADALADHHRATRVHAMNLKNRFRNIETDRANLAHGRLPSKWFVSTKPPYGTLMPQSGRRPQHQKQTIHNVQILSALPPKADIASSPRHVCLVPRYASTPWSCRARVTLPSAWVCAFGTSSP